jgi:hypothetical protein
MCAVGRFDLNSLRYSAAVRAAVCGCLAVCVAVSGCPVVRAAVCGCLAVRQFAAVCSARQCSSVWQCARLCAAVHVAVCGSARGSVWQCAAGRTALCVGGVWLQYDSVRQYGRVQHRGSSVWQCAVVRLTEMCGSASGFDAHASMMAELRTRPSFCITLRIHVINGTSGTCKYVRSVIMERTPHTTG